MNTSDIEPLVQRFIAIWNETDDDRRREGVHALWTPEGRHLMGASDARGHAALVDRVTASHRRSVVEGGNIFRPATAIQALPGVVKFRWDMARRNTGEVAAAGVGILMLSADGRIDCDYLFTES